MNRHAEFISFKFLLNDRIQKIQQIAKEYDLEHNGYIAFSGGKDSTVLHYMIDEALPGNKIPRVYSNSGLDYTLLQQFVRNMAKQDPRFVIIYPKKDVKTTLENVGYPFKSKRHSHICDIYSRQGKTGCVKKYADGEKGSTLNCPKILQYQFENELPFKISDKCCMEFKKKPFIEYEKQSKRFIGLTGMRQAEGGQRINLNCLVFSDNKLHRFHPLAPCDDKFIELYIKTRGIKLCSLYYEPYNFTRTGCVGCPFSITLKKELETMAKVLPREKVRCENIWEKVYKEYRRIRYRL